MVGRKRTDPVAASSSSFLCMCVYSTVYGFLRPLYSIAQVDLFIGPTSWNRNSRHGPSHPSSSKGKAVHGWMTELKGRHILFLLFACRFAYTFFFFFFFYFLYLLRIFLNSAKLFSFFAVGYARITRVGREPLDVSSRGFRIRHLFSQRFSASFSNKIRNTHTFFLSGEDFIYHASRHQDYPTVFFPL